MQVQAGAHQRAQCFRYVYMSIHPHRQTWVTIDLMSEPRVVSSTPSTWTNIWSFKRLEPPLPKGGTESRYFPTKVEEVGSPSHDSCNSWERPQVRTSLFCSVCLYSRRCVMAKGPPTPGRPTLDPLQWFGVAPRQCRWVVPRQTVPLDPSLVRKSLPVPRPSLLLLQSTRYPQLHPLPSARE